MERSCKLTLSKTGVENKRRNKVSDEWFLEQEEKRKVLAAVLTVFVRKVRCVTQTAANCDAIR